MKPLLFKISTVKPENAMTGNTGQRENRLIKCAASFKPAISWMNIHLIGTMKKIVLFFELTVKLYPVNQI